VFARWSAASATFMRDARGEGRRSREDTGPLRILSGDLAGAVTSGGPNSPGKIERVRTEGYRISMEKGVDLGRVPYARIHEYGGHAGRGGATFIPARPYLRPALEQERPHMAALVQRTLTRSLREALR
jgi:hypothetical protein